MPLDPANLTPAASFNRVQIADLPGVTLDPDVRGLTAHAIAAAPALLALIHAHRVELGIDPAAPQWDQIRAFQDQLRHQHPTAEAITRQIGRGFGYVLATLRRGDAVNRAAREEWDDSYWAHWGRIRQVVLGGGLLAAPHFAARLRDHALAALYEAGVTDWALTLAPFPRELPMIGMARTVPPGVSRALSCDLGHTLLKAGLAAYRDDQVTALDVVALEAVQDRLAPGSDHPDDLGAARAWFDQIVDFLTVAHRAAGLPPDALVIVRGSIAGYLRDGHPLDAPHGLYMRLAAITTNLARDLGHRLRAEWGSPVDVRLLHDGTAAAHAYAGAPHTAVIMFGTAFGVGFAPPDDSDLRALAADLRVA